ncbi:MAG: NAD(P)-dependent oxidoreductase [Paracoccaceae bacterium]|jgi:nucleoside-diphosphate-sugar epimerase|nr:NAD(P)-dependent oxidoreductase [Paracoccaceae bacterium]
MRILFTGGCGKAGRHVVAGLRAAGHRVLNVDLAEPQEARGDFVKVDLTESGQVFNAMSMRANFDELDLPEHPTFDAVVHFAAVARINLVPDNELFRVNTLSTYNVLEAATKLGINKVIIASSETAYGVCFAQGELKPDYVPVDEDHPTVPHDSYAMSKVCNEACAKSFQARSGADIYALRLNNVIEPLEYAKDFPVFVEDAGLRRRNIFGYIDIRDLTQMVEKCLATDGLGYQVFNVANADTSVAMPSDEIARQFYDGVPVTHAMDEHETFYSIAKAKRLLGFEPVHSWREKVNAVQAEAKGQ